MVMDVTASLCQKLCSGLTRSSWRSIISPAQFRGGSLFDNIPCVLVETGFSPQRLEFEVTESMLLQDREENLLLFRRLKNIGTSIALDDFGIG
jgi:EAL domain-containing protein (putative c-di-GMP-specific phosphodiesterase class I)